MEERTHIGREKGIFGFEAPKRNDNLKAKKAVFNCVDI